MWKMNRRKFLGTLALAPLGFAFKNPFSGLFKRWACSHPEENQLSHPIYNRNDLVAIHECLFCGRIRKYSKKDYGDPLCPHPKSMQRWERHYLTGTGITINSLTCLQCNLRLPLPEKLQQPVYHFDKSWYEKSSVA